MLTQERLKERLTYDLSSGDFYWNVSVPGIKKDGKAGNINPSGYKFIKVDGKLYRSHRLAFLYMEGRWPVEIDHKNGVRGDNSWENLRECTKQENQYNSKLRSDNTSGVKGVSLLSSGVWRAGLNINGKIKNLGRFNTKEEAEQAIKTVRNIHHGDFVNHGDFTNIKDVTKEVIVPDLM